MLSIALQVGAVTHPTVATAGATSAKVEFDHVPRIDGNEIIHCCAGQFEEVPLTEFKVVSYNSSVLNRANKLTAHIRNFVAHFTLTGSHQEIMAELRITGPRDFDTGQISFPEKCVGAVVLIAEPTRPYLNCSINGFYFWSGNSKSWQSARLNDEERVITQFTYKDKILTVYHDFSNLNILKTRLEAYNPETLQIENYYFSELVVFRSTGVHLLKGRNYYAESNAPSYFILESILDPNFKEMRVIDPINKTNPTAISGWVSLDLLSESAIVTLHNLNSKISSCSSLNLKTGHSYFKIDNCKIKTQVAKVRDMNFVTFSILQDNDWKIFVKRIDGQYFSNSYSVPIRPYQGYGYYSTLSNCKPGILKVSVLDRPSSPAIPLQVIFYEDTGVIYKGTCD